MATSVLFQSPVDALNFLKWAGKGLLSDPEIDLKIRDVKGRDEALGKFGSLFREKLAKLSEEQVAEFLEVAQKRLGPLSTKQKRSVQFATNPLRKAINQLVTLNEEFDDVAIRFARAQELVPGIPGSVITFVLYLAYPDQYGIWSPISEVWLRRLNLWVIEEKNEPPGRIYYDVNNRFRAVLRAINDGSVVEGPGPHVLDFWGLDVFWGTLPAAEASGVLPTLISDFQSGRALEPAKFISRWST